MYYTKKFVLPGCWF